MRSGAQFLIIIAWLVLACVAGAAPLVPHVGPYFLFERNRGLEMRWSATLGDVQIHWKNGVSVPKVQELSGLNRALLSLPACNFGVFQYRFANDPHVYSFGNIPCRGPSQEARAVFLADTQEGPGFVSQIAREISQFHPSAVVVGGDLVQEGTSYKDWVDFFSGLAGPLSQSLLIPVIGNHEYRRDANVPAWDHFFGMKAQNSFYAEDVGPLHFIVLNSCFENDPSLALKQLPWLEAELAKPALWKIVTFHHPAYSRGFFNSPLSPLREYVTLQRDYVPLFEKYHVDVVLNGHTHLFEHSLKRGIHYLTMGPAGGKMGFYGARNQFSLKSAKKRTFLEIEANARALRAVTVNIDGSMLDDLRLTK